MLLNEGYLWARTFEEPPERRQEWHPNNRNGGAPLGTLSMWLDPVTAKVRVRSAGQGGAAAEAGLAGLRHPSTSPCAQQVGATAYGVRAELTHPLQRNEHTSHKRSSRH